MGIDLYCGNVTYGCSYGGWNALRSFVINSTFKYIQDKFLKDLELYGDLSDKDENYIGEGSSYNYYKTDIVKLIESMNKAKTRNVYGFESDATLNNFINIINDLKCIDALIYFDIGGLYSFCYKNDCEGYYSVGNSVDICQLFELIEPIIKNIDEDFYNCIYILESGYGDCLYYLFKESAIKNKKITIA